VVKSALSCCTHNAIFDVPSMRPWRGAAGRHRRATMLRLWRGCSLHHDVNPCCIVFGPPNGALPPSLIMGAVDCPTSPRQAATVAPRKFKTSVKRCGHRAEVASTSSPRPPLPLPPPRRRRAVMWPLAQIHFLPCRSPRKFAAVSAVLLGVIFAGTLRQFDLLAISGSVRCSACSPDSPPSTFCQLCSAAVHRSCKH
jgi:hypothetical protein